MTKLIAVHSLLLASAVKGETDGINPGEAFMAREDELFLIERGAARKPRADEKDKPVALRRNGHALTEGQQDGGEGGNGEPEGEFNIADLTKADLLEFAKEEEIEVDEKANKPVILAAVRAALAARKDENGLI